MHTYAFLVRCWQEKTGLGDDASPESADEAANESADWHFLVMELGQLPQTPRGFANFGELAAYLSHVFAPNVSAPFPQTNDRKDSAICANTTP